MGKNRIIVIFVALAMMILSNDFAFATMTGPNADGIQGLLASGTVDDFAKYAPISTVNIDLSKTTVDDIRLDVSSTNCNNKCTSIEKVKDGDGAYFVIRGADLSASYRNMGSLTLVYPGVATLSDGTVKDLKLIFNDFTIIKSSSAPSQYKPDVRIFRVSPFGFSSGLGLMPTLAPLIDSNEKYHTGVRADLKVRIDNPDSEAATATKVSDDDTLLVTAKSVNVWRDNGGFGNIAGASSNYNYSESAMIKIQTLSPESDIYITGDHYDSLFGHYDSFVNDTGDIDTPYRFVGVSGLSGDYTSGFATVGRAHYNGSGNGGGTELRVWSSAGASSNIPPLDYYIMSGEISHEITSASGANGIIELWTSGLIDDANATALHGGDMYAPRTYTVPNGKAVTYKMACDDGYKLDEFRVNGQLATPTPVLSSAGEVLYYTYTFGEDVVDNQSISVTWDSTKSPNNPSAPVLAPNTGMNGGEAAGFGVSAIGCICAGVVLSLFMVPAVAKRTRRG